MLYRATLLLVAFKGVFGGGAVADRHLMYRREVNANTEEEVTGESALTCGGDLTPDFIRSCVYTDCFENGANAPNAPHAGLSGNGRRRLAGYTGPFPNPADCNVAPTAPNPCPIGAASCSNAVPANKAACSKADDRASKPILGESLGNNVCSYTSPTPGNGQCVCKTVRCQVIVKEDHAFQANGQNQAVKYRACNFIVRVEDTHSVPGVPKSVMWVIFGLSVFVAGSVSGFFICLYGNEAHGEHGGGHGGKEKEDDNE